MGRRLYTGDGEFVYKYVFGMQPSELCKLAGEDDIGTYDRDKDDDYTDEETGELVEGSETCSAVIDRKDMVDFKDLIDLQEPMLTFFEKKIQEIVDNNNNDPGMWNEVTYEEIKKLTQSNEYWYWKMCLAIYNKCKQIFSREPEQDCVEIIDEF